MLNYGKDCFERIWKEIKTIKSCCYVYLVAVMLPIWQGILAVTNGFMKVND